MSDLRGLEELLANGTIGRREFMKRISAMGLAVTLSPMLFNSPGHAAVPKKGGRLRLGLNGGATSDTLDPGIQLAMMPQTLVYGTLANSLVPALYPPGRQARQTRQHPPTGLGAWSGSLAYLAVTLGSLPFTLVESAFGRGAAVMVQARHA